MTAAGLITAAWLTAVAAQPAPPSVAFYYGSEPPLNALATFDWVVLEPSAVETASVGRELAPGRALAYLALGELAAGAARRRREQLPTAAILGKNQSWGSWVVDPAHPAWAEAVLAESETLWRRGFRGFFLDALDSFMTKLEPSAQGPRWAALAALISELRVRHPASTIVMNRGFPILDQVANSIDAVAAESLFVGFDPERRIYRAVPESDREWLLTHLSLARDRGLRTIVVDYLPSHRRSEMREVADRIRALGHVPWVAPAELDALGVGLLEIYPRDVVLLFDGALGDVARSPAHRFLALPLEWLGLVPRLLDVRRALPTRNLAGEVAGVISWQEGKPLQAPDDLRRFLARQLRAGVPVVLMGSPGDELNASLRRQLNLRLAEDIKVGRVEVVRAEGLGFEAQTHFPLYEMGPVSFLRSELGYEPWLQIRLDGRSHLPIVITPWGGWAFQPYVLSESAGGEARWHLDPFRFLTRALRLPSRPVIDRTTENGRRLLISHIDGDGASSRSELEGQPYALKVIRQELERSKFPHTVSLVESELSESGEKAAETLYPEARRILALEHVEPASHGYAHPFDWARFERGEPAHLPVPGGTPSLHRELRGSLEFVRTLTAKPVEVFLWTGDALPSASSFAILEAAQVQSMNGGLTVATRARPSITHMSPSGRPILATKVSGRRSRWGEVAYQVYAPVQNENVFTNGWTGPFWGYRNVRQTFDLTGRPRRLLPLGLYYHFYSGTKRASLAALREVYADLERRAPLALPASAWIKKVHQGRRSVVARRFDDAWVVDRVDEIRTLRLPEAWRDLDLARSVGVAGLRKTHEGLFAHTDGRRRILVRGVGSSTASSPSAPRSRPVLVEASARLLKVTEEGFAFEGPPPVDLTVDCPLVGPAPRRIHLRLSGPSLTFSCPRAEVSR